MMRSKLMIQLASVLCVTLLAAQAVPAATDVPISDLYNTGMSTPWDAAVQTPLPGSDPGVVVDPHWTVTTPSAVTTSTRTLSDATVPFVGNQFQRYQLDLDDDAFAQSQGYTQVNNSQWIKTNVPGITSDAPGVYVFETTFSTTMDTTMIAISGYFKATDVLGIQLNGGPIVDPGSPHGAPSEPTPSRAPSPFTITGTGGVTNTLRFYVNRPGTGLAAFRVQFTSATFTVPEPSTICLSVLGLVGFGATQLRRRFGKKSK